MDTELLIIVVVSFIHRLRKKLVTCCFQFTFVDRMNKIKWFAIGVLLAIALGVLGK